MNRITDLSNDPRVRVQFKQTPRKFRGGRVVICLGKYTYGTAQRNLEVWWLQVAVRKVGSKLQTALDVFGVLVCDTPTFDLYRDTQ